MQHPIQHLDVPIRAMIRIAGSKSITNRALLLAALADGISTLQGIQISDDTVTMIRALEALGISIQVNKHTHACVVNGSAGYFPNSQANLWCSHAGTVARFLLAACALRPEGSYYFDGSAQLRKRPITPLLDVLYHQGATFSPQDTAMQLPITLISPASLPGGEIILDRPDKRLVTSQFLSALLMIAPYARLAFTFQTTYPIVSQPYIEMTCALMAAFGVQVHQIYQGRLTVPIPQRYTACHYQIEPDLSTASYFFAAAAITGGAVTIPGIQYAASKQPDGEFISILEKMGCNVIQETDALTVIGPAQLIGIHVDMQACSDIFPTLAAIAPFATSAVTIFNIGHARYKESDRLAAMAAGLSAMGAVINCGADWITIFPSTASLHGATISCQQDHRIAMAFAVIGLKVPGVILDDANCVKKTCPEFFSLWQELHDPSPVFSSSTSTAYMTTQEAHL